MKVTRDRRMAYRITMHFPVECKVVLSDSEKILNTVTDNLSSKGLKIFCDEPLPIGKKGEVNINLIDEIINEKVEVVWCAKESILDGFCAGFAFLRELPLIDNLYTKDIFFYSGKASGFAVSLSRAKRAMDVCLSLFFLFISSPILLLVCLLIKIDSLGPILFKQWRAGEKGRRFVFYKFRSMYHKADKMMHKDYAKKLIVDAQNFGEVRDKFIYKLVRDPRITKLGYIIRKLSIDELPQFINVVKGEMSLVGPRPPVLYELEYYKERERKRLFVKPGITGLWQVSGRSSTGFRKMVELDLQYIQHWSIWLDLKIILKTVLVIFKIHDVY